MECLFLLIGLPRLSTCMGTRPRKAQLLAVSRAAELNKCDKTIIIDDSMPYAFDTVETQVHPDMDGLADQFLAPPETILDDAPTAPLVARNLLSDGLVSCIVSLL